LLAGAAGAVSLLPPAMHVAVAHACIQERVPLVTTSYASPEMRALHADAIAAGIAVVAECGLDPGIDHMMAMRSIDAVHRRGGTVRTFVSQCGGIPADPQVNLLGYKVSWSPAGVVAAARNGARYLEHGAERTLSAAEVFSAVMEVHLPGVPPLESFYNRDSVTYAETYGIKDEVTGFARMTLRYRGWCKTFAALTMLGALSDEPLTAGAATHEVLGVPSRSPDVRGAVAARLGVSATDGVLDRLEWLGVFGTDPLRNAQTKAEVIAMLMATRMQYNSGEMDRVILNHEIHTEFGNGRFEVETATLVLDGTPDGFTAMSRTVGVPAAATAVLLADGRIGLTGVTIPTVPALYEPILQVLASEQLAPTVAVLPKRL